MGWQYALYIISCKKNMCSEKLIDRCFIEHCVVNHYLYIRHAIVCVCVTSLFWIKIMQICRFSLIDLYVQCMWGTFKKNINYRSNKNILFFKRQLLVVFQMIFFLECKIVSHLIAVTVKTHLGCLDIWAPSI